jgi:hypothetical protein
VLTTAGVDISGNERNPESVGVPLRSMEASIEKNKKIKNKVREKNKKPQQAATANSGSRQQQQTTAADNGSRQGQYTAGFQVWQFRCLFFMFTAAAAAADNSSRQRQHTAGFQFFMFLCFQQQQQWRTTAADSGSTQQASISGFAVL